VDLQMVTLLLSSPYVYPRRYTPISRPIWYHIFFIASGEQRIKLFEWKTTILYIITLPMIQPMSENPQPGEIPHTKR
jgi:hypothetical protein